MVHWTPDGYRYPDETPPDNWSWIKNPGSWRQNAAANNFMVYIGERNDPGVKGFLSKIGAKGFKWIGAIIGEIIRFIPLPGMGALGQQISTGLQNAAKNEAANIISNGLLEVANKLGVASYLENVKLLLFLDQGDIDTLKGEWNKLSGHAQSIVIHYIVNRWDWERETIKAGAFDSTEGKKTFMTMIAALLFFSEFEWNKLDGWSGKNRQFFAGEGVAKNLCHFADPARWNAGSQSDLEDMRKICLMIATLEITTDKAKFDAWLEQNENPTSSASPNKKIDVGTVVGLAALAKYLKFF